MKNSKTLTNKELRKMQLLQVDMLVELDRLCRKYDIKYTMSGGTMLGAIRHKGYIPWDDDADINMLREEYEKFKKVANELNPSICFFQDHETDKNYRWGYGKIRRTDTVFVRTGQEHINCKTGVYIDIFPFDDVPISLLGQLLQDFKCFCLRKILWSEVGKKNETGLKKKWFEILSKIPVNFVYSCLKKDIEKSRNDSPNGVRTLLFPAIGHLYKKNPLKIRYAMPKKWYVERAEYEFEGKKLFGAKDYDGYLKYVYGDYMTMPPKSKQIPKIMVSEFKF